MIQEILKQILLQLDKSVIFRNELSMISSHLKIGIFYIVKIGGSVDNAKIPSRPIYVIYAELPCQVLG
jgi:hypothetical protein